MVGVPPNRFWMDIPAAVGEGRYRDFQYAVHLTIYWAQDMSGGPICNPVHPPKRLAEKLRKALPISADEIALLGEGRWPPTEASLDLRDIPRNVPLTPVKLGRVTWMLSDEKLDLRKEVDMGAYTYSVHIDITATDHVRIRQTVTHMGERAPVPGVPRNLKLLSAICGLFDGDIRLLPVPMIVNTIDDVEAFLRLAENPDRLQPIIAVAMAEDESQNQWRGEVEDFAREAFALQHVVGVTVSGVARIREILGPHGLLPGAIKTYNAGFSLLDVPSDHQMTMWSTIREHNRGRVGMLKRWHRRLMSRDAYSRRDDPSVDDAHF
jgi:hypothetical protein